MTANPASPKRSRGAQRGNTNALKYGFYARRFQSGELADLDAAFTEGLADEINLLRVVMRRLFSKATDAGEELSLNDLSNILGALGLTATRLSSLLTKQRILVGEDDTTAAAISEALATVVKELGLQP